MRVFNTSVLFEITSFDSNEKELENTIIFLNNRLKVLQEEFIKRGIKCSYSIETSSAIGY